jgi:predicted glutamine amidotransferase
VIVSEPLDHSGDNWVEVPHNSFLTAYKGEVVREEFM